MTKAQQLRIEKLTTLLISLNATIYLNKETGGMPPRFTKNLLDLKEYCEKQILSLKNNKS